MKGHILPNSPLCFKLLTVGKESRYAAGRDPQCLRRIRANVICFPVSKTHTIKILGSLRKYMDPSPIRRELEKKERFRIMIYNKVSIQIINVSRTNKR